jgi:hypothetical protein
MSDRSVGVMVRALDEQRRRLQLVDGRIDPQSRPWEADGQIRAQMSHQVAADGRSPSGKDGRLRRRWRIGERVEGQTRALDRPQRDNHRAIPRHWNVSQVRLHFLHVPADGPQSFHVAVRYAISRFLTSSWADSA